MMAAQRVIHFPATSMVQAAGLQSVNFRHVPEPFGESLMLWRIPNWRWIGLAIVPATANVWCYEAKRR